MSMRPLTDSFLIRVAAILAFVCLASPTGRALSFPFRAFEVGDLVPAAAFVEYKDHHGQTLTDLRGKNILVVFWGADLPEKKEHSALILKQLDALHDFFEDREIAVLSVNIQSDPVETIDEVLALSGAGGPVFIDPTRQAYGSLGVYVMPALLLIDRTGRAVSGLGYSRNSVNNLKDEVTILLGEKTRAEIAGEARAGETEIPAARQRASCHLNFATVMLKRGMTDSALREFEQALLLDAGLGEAAIQLGCLYLERGNLAMAEDTLRKASTLMPDSLEARLCAAQLQARQGKPAEARLALEELQRGFPDTPKIDYLLGRLQEDQGQPLTAARHYRRAYDLLNARRHEPPTPAAGTSLLRQEISPRSLYQHF